MKAFAWFLKLVLLLAVIATEAGAQDCNDTLGGVGGAECEGKRYLSRTDGSVELNIFHRLDYVRFHQIPLHPFTLFIHKPVAYADPDNGFALNLDENTWFFASIDARFSTQEARIVLHERSNITGIWLAPPGLPPREITDVQGPGAAELDLQPGQVVVLRNKAGHFAAVTIKKLIWTTPASQPRGQLPAEPGRLEVGRDECRRNLYDFHGLQVCDVNHLRIKFDVSIQLFRGSADFSGIDRSTTLDCDQPQGNYYHHGENSISLRTPEYFPSSGPLWVTSYSNVPFAPVDFPPGARWRITHPDLAGYWRYRDQSMQFFADIESSWPQSGSEVTYILPAAQRSAPGALAAPLLFPDKARVRGNEQLVALNPGQPVWDGDLMLMKNREGRFMLLEMTSVRVRSVNDLYHFTEVDAHPELCEREALSFDNGYCRVFLTELRYRYWIMKRLGELDFSCAR